MTGDTGFNVRAGSAMLAERRVVSDRDREVAEAILRRWKIQRLARRALDILDGRRSR